MSTTPAPGTAEGEGRFWSKVHRGPEGACWIWLGAIADDGYGRYYLHDGAGGMVRPHRYAYALAHEIELEELGELMHVCDVPVCVNPAHLQPGDHTENMRDRMRKGRADNGAARRFRGLPRAAVAARSRARRDDVQANGGTPDRVAAIIAGQDVDAPTLF